MKLSHNIHVVANFLSQVIFVFLLFLVMVTYANEVEIKEKEKLPEIKINYVTYRLHKCMDKTEELT